MTGTSSYPLDPRFFPPVRGEAGFPFFVVTSVELSYTFYKRTHTYIYLIVPAREMPQCLQCWRDDVGSFQSKCYMENK